MLLSRLFWRIFMTYAGIMLLAVILLVQFVVYSHEKIMLNQVQSHLRYLTSTILSDAKSYLDHSIGEANFGSRLDTSMHADYWVMIYSPEGKAVYDSRNKEISRSSPSRVNTNLLRISTWDTTLATGTGYFHTGELSQSDSLAVHLKRIGTAEKPEGVLVVSYNLAQISVDLLYTKYLTWIVALFMVILILVIGYFVVLRIIKPLDVLTQAAESIVAGDLKPNLEFNQNDELGTLTRAFVSMREELSSRIMEMQKQGKKLQENSERLATILGGMVEGVIAVDADQNILFSNKAAYDLIEFEGSKVVGRPVWESIRNTAIQQMVHDVLHKQDQLKTELFLPRSNATIIITASRLPGVPCPGMVMVMHDITEIRRLETMRKEFVSNVHHELKTPLASIQAYTETLLDGAIDDAEVNKQFLERINQAVERLNDLIMDLLKLARIESVEQAYEVIEFPVSGCISEVVESHRFAAEAKQIELVIQPPDDELIISADPHGLCTVLDNLLSNAIKYSPLDSQVEIRWSLEGKMAAIEVQDHGEGIPAEHHARIFERFYRVDKARARDIGGTGLGLAIVKHIVQIFHGTIELKSQPGSGSTFIVRIPVSRFSIILD